jgi:hypothetical protein
VTLTSVTSSEQDDAPGLGDGHTLNDIQEAPSPGDQTLCAKLSYNPDGKCPGIFSAASTAERE